MSRFANLFVVAALAFGCGDKHDDHDHEGHDHAAPTEVAEALKNLSAADRALVEAQKMCPVSDEGLGTMGEPIRMTVGDDVVFLCCQGCVKRFNADPQKYLAKIKK